MRNYPLKQQYRIVLIALLFLLVSVPATSPAETRPGSVEDPLNGKTIRNIDIVVRDIFQKPEPNAIYRTANSLKIKTKEHVVRQELLVKEGDKYDRFLIDESIRALRRLPYFRRVEIIPAAKGEYVDLLVRVQDTWTFIPQFSFSGGDGRDRFSAGLVESNLLGYGKRIETFYAKEDNRETIAAAYDDRRVMGSRTRFTIGGFTRSDGQSAFLDVGQPFFNLVDPYAWHVTLDDSDIVGRLFQNGNERFIYRTKRRNASLRYTIARGKPESHVLRFAFGYQYSENKFSKATLDDYADLGLNPSAVSNDPSMLADDRIFSGPLFSLQSIEPDFISMNYIDRFSRVEDYNLGEEWSVTFFPALEFFGSDGNQAILSGSLSDGKLYSKNSFFRWEVSANSRYKNSELENSLISLQLKYFNVLGPVKIGSWELGKHTLAGSLFVDYGDSLDRDRELLLGGDSALRGYDARTFSGDKRYAINIEDRMHFVDDWLELISVGAALFAEAGGSTFDNFGDLVTDHTFADVGIGLRFAFPRSESSRVFRIDLAIPLRDGPDGTGAFEPRILFGGGQVFDARLRTEKFGPEQTNLLIGIDR
ncbi:MAG: hypothetical protein D6719_04435 [Candidatus Dadabacteria bacterium]|nr:MAG: hypothetical protein D6719_04435 [Candidatus Dadabacteria bacterium]